MSLVRIKGFSLIELMAVYVILSIFMTIVMITVTSGNSPNISFGFNGVIEQRCIGGLIYNIDSYGVAHQVFGVNGGGVACQ